MKMAEEEKVIPMVIVSGFLGAGKSTLLNYILTQEHGKKIAVIENEFGEEIGIESLVLKDIKTNNSSSSSEVMVDFYELSNGCICCSVKDDFVNTVESLVKQRKHQIDYIVVETTGMANPGPLASMFWLDEELESQIRLDGIVTLVDSTNILRQLHHTPVESTSQIAYADRVFLNKKDLLAAQSADLISDMHRIENVVQNINGLARISWTEQAVVDLDEFFHIEAFAFDEKALAIDSSPSSSSSSLHVCSEENHDHCEHQIALHTNNISTVCVRVQQHLDLDKLTRWFGVLLWENDTDSEMKIIRIKGVLKIQNEKEKYILQGVHELFDCEPTQEVWDPENESLVPSKIIFIGSKLDEQFLQAGLGECTA